MQPDSHLGNCVGLAVRIKFILLLRMPYGPIP
jgi:hypothetical protein